MEVGNFFKPYKDLPIYCKISKFKHPVLHIVIDFKLIIISKVQGNKHGDVRKLIKFLA